jgi:hypothetical protein
MSIQVYAMTNDGNPCTQSPSTINGTIHINRYVGGSREFRVVKYTPLGYNPPDHKPVSNIVEEKHVYVKNVNPDGKTVYKNVPEKLKDLNDYQEVEVEFLPPCEGRREYELYRIIV